MDDDQSCVSTASKSSHYLALRAAIRKFGRTTSKEPEIRSSHTGSSLDPNQCSTDVIVKPGQKPTGSPPFTCVGGALKGVDEESSTSGFFSISSEPNATLIDDNDEEPAKDSQIDETLEQSLPNREGHGETGSMGVKQPLAKGSTPMGVRCGETGPKPTRGRGKPVVRQTSEREDQCGAGKKVDAKDNVKDFGNEVDAMMSELRTLLGSRETPETVVDYETRRRDMIRDVNRYWDWL